MHFDPFFSLPEAVLMKAMENSEFLHLDVKITKWPSSGLPGLPPPQKKRQLDTFGREDEHQSSPISSGLFTWCCFESQIFSIFIPIWGRFPF